MAKRKKSPAAVRPAQPTKKKNPAVSTWIAGAVAVLAIATIAVIVLAGGSKNASAGATAPAAATTASAAGAVPADERRYIGRLLPANYTEASVASPTTYSSTIKMTDVTAAHDAKQVSIPLASVVSDKIVYFEYTPAGGGAAIPMVAYVKPSGKLYVGVGFCLPCKGTRQRIDADGTLTCEACGTKRDIETGVGLSGTCRLYPLDEVPATVSGGKIIVRAAVLNGWTPQPADRPVGA